MKPYASLQELVEVHARWLTEYQNAAYARSYLDFVSEVQSGEARITLLEKIDHAQALGVVF